MKFVPVFTSLIVIVFLLAFIVLPKSSFSEIENRSLASFPKFATRSWQSRLQKLFSKGKSWCFALFAPTLWVRNVETPEKLA